MAAAIFAPAVAGIILQLLNVALAALEARGEVGAGEARALTDIVESAVNEGRDLTAEERARLEAFIEAQRSLLHA